MLENSYDQFSRSDSWCWQRKFREVDAEESYFEADEEETPRNNMALRTLSPTLLSGGSIEKNVVPAITQSQIINEAKNPI